MNVSQGGPERHLPVTVMRDFVPGFVEGLLCSIDAPKSAAGLIPALQGLIIALDSFAKGCSKPELDTLIADINHLRERLSREDVASQIRTIPDIRSVGLSYRLLIDVASANVDKNICQLLGAIFMQQIFLRQPLARYRAESLYLLAISDPRHHRRSFEDANVLDEEVITKVCAQHHRKAVQELAPWLIAAIRGVCDRPIPSSGRTALSARMRGPITEESVADEADAVIESESEEYEVGSLVVWLFGRTRKGTMAGSAGLDHWNNLSPIELKRVTERLRAVFVSTGHDHERLAACAVLSLATSLPIKKLLRIPLTPNEDIWIDLHRGAVVWNLSWLMLREPVAGKIEANGYRPSQYVHLPLPRLAIDVLLQAQCQSGTLADALFGNVPVDRVATKFGDFLRGICHDEEGRPPYSARFSCSLGSAIDHVTGDWLAAAYAALDFRFFAASEPYYLCLPAERLFDSLAKTYSWLGLGSVSQFSSDQYIGSPLVPRPDVFEPAIRQLIADLGELRRMRMHEIPLEECLTNFNRRAVLTAAIFVSLTADRGTAMERRTIAALYGHPDIAIIFDKETESSVERPIPVTKGMRNLLDAYLHDLRELATRLQTVGHATTATHLFGIAELTRPSSPTFVACRCVANQVRLAPVRSADINNLLATHGMARNAGRHYLLSKLAAPQYPAYLRRALSGHAGKAAGAFHRTAGLAPIEVLDELRVLLTETDAACGLSDSCGSTAQRPTLQKTHIPVLVPSRMGQLKDQGIEAFVRRDGRNVGRESRRFALSSSLAYAHACSLRHQLLNHRGPLSAPGALLLSLILIECESDADACILKWQAMVNRQMVLLGKTIWGEILLPGGRRRVFAPLLPTQMMLKELLDNGEVYAFEDARTELATWVRKSAPRIKWPNDESAVLDVVLKLALHLSKFELPPWLISAESATLQSSSIALTALARRAGMRPLHSTASTSPYKQRRYGVKQYGTIRSVLRHLNHLSNRRLRHGEDAARKRELLSRLQRMQGAQSVLLPMTHGVIEYLIAECGHLPDNRDPIVTGTMANYLGVLADALEKRVLLHPMEMSHDDWKELLDELKRIAKDRQREWDPSPLRRFARYWRGRGASVPNDIFHDQGSAPDESVLQVPWSAASFFVWQHEFEAITHMVLQGIPRGSLDHEVVTAFLSLLGTAPQRAAETHYLRLEDFDHQLRQIAVTSSGFAHLKSGECTRRIITLPEVVADQLSALQQRLRAASPSREYFFFDGRQPMDDERFLSMVSRVAMALRTVTGDENVRRHSLRGVAECGLLVGNADAFINCVLHDGQWETQEPSRSARRIETWRHVVRVAAQAGHHPLTAVSTYLTIWPILARRYRNKILDVLWPGESLAKAGGVSPSNLRVIKHRAVKNKIGALVLWRRLASALPLESLAPAKIPLGETKVLTTEDFAPVATNTRPPVLAERIWCLAMLAVGERAQAISDRFGINLDENDQRLLEGGLSKYIPNQRVNRDFLKILIQHGLDIANRFEERADLGQLRAANSAIRAAERIRPATDTEIIDAMKAVLAVLPANWRVAVLPECEGLSNNVLPVLRSLDQNLFIKEPSRSELTRYRFSVAAPNASNISPRSLGAGTRVLSLLLSIACEILQSKFTTGAK